MINAFHSFISGAGGAIYHSVPPMRPFSLTFIIVLGDSRRGQTVSLYIFFCRLLLLSLLYMLMSALLL